MRIDCSGKDRKRPPEPEDQVVGHLTLCVSDGQYLT